jgi:hypothetical protein
MVGPCRFVTCDSTLGSSFRALMFMMLDDLRATSRVTELPVCPAHERYLREQERKGHRIRLTMEGWIYLEAWMTAPLYAPWGSI